MNRRFLVLISALLGIGVPVSGQAQGISFGATIGLNRASLASDENPEDFDSKFGLMIGGFMDIATGDRLAIRPELLFTQKGASGEDGDDEGTLNFSYIEVPVLARFALDVRGARPVTPVFFAGPSFGYLLDAELVSPGEEDAGDVSDLLKSTDLGLVLGAGIEASNLSFDLRYEFGLTALDDAEDIAELSNRVLSLTIGYALPLGM